MKLSREELVKVVERSSSLTECLEAKLFLNHPSKLDAPINARLEKWLQTAAKGDREQFEKRLTWDELTLSDVYQALGAVSVIDEQNLPLWVETLREGIQAAALVAQKNLDQDVWEENSCIDPQEPVPFEEVFLPFIQVARRKFIAQVGNSYDLLSETAKIDIERNLLGSLANLCSHILELKFSDFRDTKQSALSRLLGQHYNHQAKEQYHNFLKEMFSGGLISFFLEYPVLARLVAIKIDFWVDVVGEFLQRLASDWTEIQQNFQPGVEIGQVIAINSSLSDPHNSGRSVFAIVFACGLKLIYKPRDLGLEEAYFKLLAWFNRQEVPLPFKLVKVLNYSTYGWVEFVKSSPCENKQEVQRYYQRAGMLLCVLYVLKANDCHHENLIACGEHPVLVDMETLMHHQVREMEEVGKYAQAQSLANQQLQEDSVLRSGLLPQWIAGPDGQGAFDLSGLGGDSEQETSYRVPKWYNINTDSMSLGYELATIPSAANVPSMNGVTLSPNNYVAEIVDGFEQMYQFLIRHREAFLTSDSPLTTLVHQQVRSIFRPTRVYAAVLQKSLHPKYLRNGVERSIELEALSRALLSSNSKPLLWSLLKKEIQALEQMDIPYFSTYSDSVELLISPSETIEQCFKQPSYYGVISCLQQLNEQDLARQIAIIKGSLYSRVTTATNLSDPLPLENTHLDLNTIIPLSQEEIVQQAIAIALEMQQRAICASDGSATWVGLGYLPDLERFQFQALGYDLYDGSCGVALFLAALAAVTNSDRFHDLTLGALQYIRNVLQELDPGMKQKIFAQIGIGGATGIGSIVYALVKISKLLREPALLEDAKQAALLITPERIAVDRKFDVMNGSAGAILGLLALHEVSPDPAVLESAIACGKRLLDSRISSQNGTRAWATIDGKLMAGFSHGAAGIAYALLRLYEIAQDPAFLAAATEAIAYERSIFSGETGNWSDLRSEKQSFSTRWCHGATGIGLARLGSLSVYDRDEIRQEIDVALKTTQQVNWQDVDRLCCGNFGRIEFLQVAASKLSRPELLEVARKQASWIVARAKQSGSFHLFPNLPQEITPPGLFLGTAGIGYGLLRLAYPNLLPSVLLWE